MKILKAHSDYIVTVGGETFTTTSINNLMWVKWVLVNYENLSPKEKNRILRSYCLHQRADQLGSFRL